MKTLGKRTLNKITWLGTMVLQMSLLMPSRGDIPVRWRFFERDRKIVDVLPYKDDTMCVVFERQGPHLIKSGEVELKAMPMAGEKDLRCLRIFRATSEGDEMILVGRTSKGPCLYACKGGRWTKTLQVDDPVESLRCYQDRSGAIWIYSNDGIIYRIADGKAVAQEYAPRIDKSKGSYSVHRPVCPIESADGTVCFFLDHGGSLFQAPINHLLSHRQGVWQKTGLAKSISESESNPSKGPHIGSACFQPDGKVLVASEQGIHCLELGKEGGDPHPIPPPWNGEAVQSRPLFLTRLSDGTLISIWQKRLGDEAVNPMDEDGFSSQLVEYRNGKWFSIPLGGDRTRWSLWDSERPYLADREGGLWLATKVGGLLHRASDGKWVRVDWKQGLALKQPSRLVLDSRDQLWVVNANGACVVLDGKAALSTQAPPASQWSEEFLQSNLIRRNDGCVCGASPEQGGSMVVFKAEGKEHLPLNSKLFRTENTAYLTRDTEDALWLFAYLNQGATAYHDGTRWNIFAPEQLKDLPIHHKEAAFQTRLNRGEDYRIGAPGDIHHVLFTKDGKIVFKNERNRICYFDGKMWHAPYLSEESKPALEWRAQPFFHDGKVTVTVDSDGRSYQMDETAWVGAADDPSPRPWKEIAMIPSPFPKEHAEHITRDCPLAEKDRWWVASADGWTWVAGANKLFASAGEGWIEVPNLVSPLPLGEIPNTGSMVPGAMMSDSSGRWWFHMGGLDHHYVVYQGEQVKLEPSHGDLGHFHEPFATLKLPIQSSSPTKPLLFRHRLDHLEWSPLRHEMDITLGILPKGKHTVRLEAFGKADISKSNLVEYQFDVDYDMEAALDDLIRKLGDGSFKTREDASRSLVMSGVVALEKLAAAAKSSDPEVSVRARDIIREIQNKK